MRVEREAPSTNPLMQSPQGPSRWTVGLPNFRSNPRVKTLRDLQLSVIWTNKCHRPRRYTLKRPSNEGEGDDHVRTRSLSIVLRIMMEEWEESHECFKRAKEVSSEPRGYQVAKLSTLPFPLGLSLSVNALTTSNSTRVIERDLNRRRQHSEVATSHDDWTSRP